MEKQDQTRALDVVFRREAWAQSSLEEQTKEKRPRE